LGKSYSATSKFPNLIVLPIIFFEIDKGGSDFLIRDFSIIIFDADGDGSDFASGSLFVDKLSFLFNSEFTFFFQF
jgi:hypothetical protein